MKPETTQDVRVPSGCWRERAGRCSVRLIAFLLSVGLLANAGVARASLAFVDVTVVPLDSARTLPGQIVLVQGDRIVAVGPKARVALPPGTLQIDGAGRFLLPGLGEMHGHNPPDGAPPEEFDRICTLFVAHGVTTVRSMLGFTGQLEWRDRARRGEILAPNLYLAGPSFTGVGPSATRTPQQAVERVRAQKAEGWDLLKVHPGLKRDVYDAIAATAKELGLEFSGHVPADVGLVGAIERGQRTVDHLDGYLEHLGAQDGPIDPAKLAAIVRLTRESGTWVVPTMVLWETILGAADPAERAAMPELKYLPLATVESWRAGYARRVAAPGFDAARAQRIAANRKVLLKALAEGGARILFGTDAPQQFSVPGFSVLREMKAMEAAGMTRLAVLQSATKNVGEYYQAVDRFGLVAPGHRADLLLLTANPLQDLGHLGRRAGVMVRGKWIPEAELQARLARLAATR